jgi:hypothetical protein
MAIKKTTATQQDINVVHHKIVTTQNQRGRIDIAKYLTAIREAESVANPSRANLYDIYEHRLLDGHLQGIMSKRINSVLNKPLFFKDKDGSVVEELTNMLQGHSFRAIMKAIMESIFWGVSGLEFIPSRSLSLASIPRKHIKPHNQTISLNQHLSSGEINYSERDNIWVIGDSKDLGALLPATVYAIFKNNAISDWANFIQTFGMPIRIGKYQVQDKVTQAALIEALDAAGSALSILLPKEADFEMVDAKSSNANGELQSSFVKYMDSMMSIAILGNTETTSSDKTGSLAKAKVHSNQQDEIIKSDMALVQAYLNDPKFITILQSYGLPVTIDGNFEFNKDIDIAFLAERIKIDKELIAMGLPIGHDYLYETYNIPKAEAGDAVLGKAENAPSPADNKPKNLSAEIDSLLDAKLSSFFG